MVVWVYGFPVSPVGASLAPRTESDEDVSRSRR